MNSEYEAFHERVARINKMREQNRGRDFVVRHDGVLVPRKSRRSRFAFPWRGLFATLVAALLIKATLIAALGSERYVARLDILLAGSPLQATGQVVLGPDPLSVRVAAGMLQVVDWAQSL